MKAASLIGMVLVCAGCAQAPVYENDQAFERELATWQLTGRTLAEASVILSRYGFSCSDAKCSRNAGSFPCVQHQWIDLVLDAQGLVEMAQIKKLSNGHLPSSCV
jgi:hypothetical protein